MKSGVRLFWSGSSQCVTTKKKDVWALFHIVLWHLRWEAGTCCSVNLNICIACFLWVLLLWNVYKMFLDLIHMACKFVLNWSRFNTHGLQILYEIFFYLNTDGLQNLYLIVLGLIHMALQNLCWIVLGLIHVALKNLY